MAKYLYRLGRFSFGHRRLVAAAWLAVLVGVLIGAATLSGSTSNAFSIPGTPSQKAIDLLGERFPQASADGATARVVFAADDGAKLTDASNKAAIERAVAELGEAPQVASVSDPFTSGAVNEAGTIGFAQATYTVQSGDVTDQARDALTAVVDEARTAGLTVEVGGDAVQAEPATGATEAIGVVVAAVVLAITFGAIVAAGLPLLTAILGIAITLGAITAASGFFDLSANTSVLALMLGLAVAIDYALLIVSRYRHELNLGRDRQEAAGRAVGTAGSAVVFAGLTVVIALAALFVVGIPFMTTMGLAAAFAVIVAVLVAVTLLPALLGFTGRRLLAGRIPGLQPRDPENDGESFGFRWARVISRRPVPVLIAAILALGVVSIPALDLHLAMPDDGTAAPDTTQRKAYDLLAEGFGPGFNGPLVVVVDGDGSVKATAEQVAGQIKGLTDVAAVAPAVYNESGNTAMLSVIPKSAPGSTATEDLVRDIRGLSVSGGDIGVTGLTAINIDISEKLAGALIPYLAVVVGLAFLVLTMVFRSLLVPLKATAGFLLSIAATFGAVVAVFQWGWLADLLGVSQTGPIISFLPIFLIGIVFGLAMDYQVFLVTRMREEYVHGGDARQAVVNGFGHGARVVTAAAIIMISVFSGFILSPESFIKSIGFALGIAVFFDAFVVRMTIVPAVMSLLGRPAWWLPRWLDRLVPNVDVEGEKLREFLPDDLDDTSLRQKEDVPV